MLHLVTCRAFTLSSFSTLPNLQLQNRPLSAVRDSLFNIFTATHISVGRLVHLQPEDVLCRGDSDPHITALRSNLALKDNIKT
jgi:hypothetical protein